MNKTSKLWYLDLFLSQVGHHPNSLFSKQVQFYAMHWAIQCDYNNEKDMVSSTREDME